MYDVISCIGPKGAVGEVLGEDYDESVAVVSHSYDTGQGEKPVRVGFDDVYGINDFYHCVYRFSGFVNKNRVRLAPNPTKKALLKTKMRVVRPRLAAS